MAHLWVLTGVNGDPTYLNVYTDDDNLVIELQQPAFRSSDVTIKNLMSGWEEYAPDVPVLVKDIERFMEYITVTYDAYTYEVRQLW